MKSDIFRIFFNINVSAKLALDGGSAMNANMFIDTAKLQNISCPLRAKGALQANYGSTRMAKNIER